LKELEDHKFFPAVLRNYQTQFIGFVVSAFKVYDGFVQYTQTLSLPPRPMYDLCSGSGEPAIGIFRKSTSFTRLTLSDKYPNPSRYPGEEIFYEPRTKDVLAMEFHSGAYYTMFNAFHHFSDLEKMQIAKRILAANTVAFFVEILEPGIFCFMKVIFLTTAGTLLFTPFVKPFSLKRLLFTYVLPVNVFTITFDGIVSVFKSRSVKYYKDLFSSFGHSVKIFRVKTPLTPMIIIHIQDHR
jgi:hypothetical protein